MVIRSATTYPAIVGRILTGLRERLGVSQAQLGDAVGVTQSTWSKIERGESTLSLDQLRAATAFLRASPGAVLIEADRAVIELERQGVKVHPTRVNAPASSGFALISGAALAVLLGAAAAALASTSAAEKEPGNEKKK